MNSMDMNSRDTRPDPNYWRSIEAEARFDVFERVLPAGGQIGETSNDGAYEGVLLVGFVVARHCLHHGDALAISGQ